MEKNQSLKSLNIGCGKCVLPKEEGWVNVDLFSNVNADTYADMLSLPFEKESFDRCYSSHVLEHQHRHAVVATLNYWKSFLKPGGLLRLAVPDFEAVCKYYQKTQDMRAITGLIWGGQDGHLNRHTVGFDEKYLTELLLKAGFVDVKRWDWRTTDHANYDDYSQAYLPTHLDKENGLLVSLNLEATKPL